MSSYPIIKIPDALERAYRSQPVLANFEPYHSPDPISVPQHFNLPVLAIEAVLAILIGGRCWKCSGWLGIGTSVGGLILVMIHAWAMNNTYADRWYLYRTQSDRDQQQQWEVQLSQARSERLQTDDGIARYRRQKVSAVLKHTQAHRRAVGSLSPAAAQFAKILAKWFPEHINTDAGIALIDRDSNLHISLEVDEPYQKINGEIQATHYAGATADQQHNNYYLDRGWVVVRFSALQTADHADSCCKVIAELAAEFLQNENWLAPFATVDNLAAAHQWTQSEAQQLATLAQRQYA
jgi:hypothetical protein